ncbi:MAG: 2-oxoisovalerate dehydrogenase [Bacteroidia bacterium]
MEEIIFLVQDSPEGGFEAKALGESIFCEGDTIDELKENLKDAVKCHFDFDKLPKIIRLHITKDELITL